ncbi:hypothetical protein Agabi119p4_7277 [Agaricus bisporus var. burnettii]|uniref:G-patch domain-containing protein n=1 Tax=Agaricus bisporus var. burnettii TaxID=192524 RepID=A0A8H7EYS5_AGABI|nr:hypothetical protein Agabi119p4_7277 [Agaricus bisporus var. burnettii]
MATTSYTIYSHYDPDKDKERLQLETNQVPDTDTETDADANKGPDDDDKLWREAASASFLRAQRPPPKFVPATISYGFDSDAGPSTSKHTTSSSSLGTSLSSWYRSLAMANDSGPSSYQPRPSSAPVSTSSSVEESKKSLKERRNRTQTKKNKDDWFIQKVLQSAPSSSAPSTPPPTLADILARDPPPLPSEPKYHPPVWLEIGPSNRGFTMLQKGGWNEGEALGAGGRGGSRGLHTQSSSSSSTTTSYLDKGKHKTRDTEMTMMKLEKKREQQDGHGPSDVRPAEKISNDVIDLTLTDSESEIDEEVGDIGVKEEEEEEFSEAHNERIRNTNRKEGPNDNSHGGTALLTPIATVLKLDRLGIGLKAKTEGPYKASVKRVTHHAAALNAHMKAAQEARKRREKFGRGRRGYERQKRGEEERRQNLIAYMNS